MRRLLTLLLLLSASLAHAEGFTRAEIQKFIDDAIQAGGGEVILPPGTHRIDQPLLLRNAAKIRLAGLDPEDTFLRPVADAPKPFPLIRVEGSADRLEIAKITLTTEGSTFADTPLIDIRTQAPAPQTPPTPSGAAPQPPAAESPETSSTLRIDRCLFESHPGCAIQLLDSPGVEITAGSFRDLADGAVRASGTTTRLLVQHNHFIRCGSPAIALESATLDARITANDFHDATTLQLEGSGHQLTDNSGLSATPTPAPQPPPARTAP